MYLLRAFIMLLLGLLPEFVHNYCEFQGSLK